MEIAKFNLNHSIGLGMIGDVHDNTGDFFHTYEQNEMCFHETNFGGK